MGLWTLIHCTIVCRMYPVCRAMCEVLGMKQWKQINKERCYYPYDLCEWVPIFKERIAAFVNIQSLIHLYLMILFMVSYKT